MRTIVHTRVVYTALLSIGAALVALAAGYVAFPHGAIAAIFSPFLPLQVSTVPTTIGDTNPYGLAFVPVGFPSGAVKPGQILVSNFNNTNTQGLGTTIISIDPNGGKTALFFQGNSPIGFTNALTIARTGLVFGGSLPTSGGTPESGPLYVFDRNGNVVTTLGAHDLAMDRGEWLSTTKAHTHNYSCRIYSTLQALVDSEGMVEQLHGSTSVCTLTQSRC